MISLKREYSCFKKLSAKSRLLVFSFGLRSLTQPLFTLFVNAFIWRSTASFLSVGAYNLGFFIAVPIGFFVNGLILRKIRIVTAHFLGMFLSIAGIIMVVFSTENSLLSFLIYGMIFGFGMGIYWSNRNYLTFQETEKNTRNYFFSISSIIDSTAKIITSFLIGWFIVFGENTGLYSVFTAYVFITVLALIAIVLAGLILVDKDYHSPVVKKVWKPYISKSWNTIRLANFGLGFLEGVGFFLPTLLILYYLGKEGTLGTIVAIVTIFTLIITYLYGRLAKPQHRQPVFLFSLVILIAISAFLAFGVEPYNVLIYVLLAGMPSSFFYLTIHPSFLDVMDKEISNHPEEKYILICDQEIFLNFGRIVSVSVLFLLAILTTELYSFKITPLVLTLIGLPIMIWAWKKLEEK